MSNYLRALQSATATRFWVNNPTLAEAKAALAAGAHSCTTNPAHCAKILQTDPAFMRQIIRDTLAAGVSPEDAPEAVYHNACKALMDLFLPLFRQGTGEGYVTVQEDPRKEEDTDYIIAASLRANALAPNHMAKIPVHAAGLKIIEAMVEHDIPICATEIFTLSQALTVWDVYNTAAKRHNKRPPMYVTHITGIMDDYFADLVKKEKIGISPEALSLAGTAIARKQYRLFKERNIPCLMLGGGVRRMEHFTNFVGGDMHITINWPTGEELAKMDANVEKNIDRETPESIISELLDTLPNFRRAYEEDGLSVEEYADYGPVMLFRTQFMNGFSRLVDEIRLIASENRKK